MRGIERASLATSLAGQPYVSLVLAATAPEGDPLLLISDLAQHTRNIAAEPQVALLFDGTIGLDEPLTGPRLTLLGRASRVEDEELLARFCRRHPSAGGYAGFADFHLYRVAPSRGHLVAGFGQIDWIEGSTLRVVAPALEADEAALIEQLNAEATAPLDLCAAGLPDGGGGGWRATGIDAEGIDLRRGGRVLRLDFPAPAETPDDARRCLVELAAVVRPRG